MGALIVKVGLGLLKTVLTEKLFLTLIARAAVLALEKLAESTKTDIDDTLIEPLVMALKEHY